MGDQTCGTGGGSVAEDGTCDSESYCGPALHGPSFYFVADGDSRETCSRGCAADAQCGTGFACTTCFTSKFCVPACTENEHCPTDRSITPASASLKRLSGNPATGRCQP